MRSGLSTRLLGITALAVLGVSSFTDALFARAGGGGGRGHGGGGGHSGGFSGGGYHSSHYGGYNSYGSSGHFGFSVFIKVILLIVLLFAIFAAIAYFRKASKAGSSWEAVPEVKPDAGINTQPRQQATIPGFDEVIFFPKVHKAFMEVQSAWREQNTDRMRRFISDGVYQRFNTQFKMMRLLQQTNHLSDINISKLWVDRMEQDGQYDIVHAGIRASMTDRFVCALNHDLDEQGNDEFVEYWSFIRKRGVAGKDIYDSDKCPNCGAPLPKDMGEICKCKYCNATINSGEFDWVLAEITQEEDYHRDEARSEKSPSLDAKVAQMAAVYGDFAVQLVEDKASNAWMQMMTAQAMHDPTLMRRFVTDDLYRQLAPQYEQNREIFNRIYLNRVTLVNAEQRDGKNILTFTLTASTQRASLTGSSVRLVDLVIIKQEEIMTLIRDASASAGKGSIYQHTCSSCGAPVKDSLDLKCAFCGSPLNSTANDWVVSGLMSRWES